MVLLKEDDIRNARSLDMSHSVESREKTQRVYGLLHRLYDVLEFNGNDGSGVLESMNLQQLMSRYSFFR